ncbi:MAG: hypothetical protein WBG17_02225 [Burkholderiaceae bacterium]
MTALTADRNTLRRDGVDFEYPVKSGAKIFTGSIVAISTANGFATKGATATTLKCVGVAQEQADNTNGADGDIRVKVRRGVFRFANSASTDAITLADVGADCYLVDDQTVAKTSNTNARSVAGKVEDVDSGGVWVRF